MSEQTDEDRDRTAAEVPTAVVVLVITVMVLAVAMTVLGMSIEAIFTVLTLSGLVGVDVVRRLVKASRRRRNL
ncbi:hypothetical protein ACWCQK_36670 [Streptomyces sp. NPDC002306]